MNTKSDIRLWAKSIRKSLDVSAISIDICRNIRSLDVYKSAENVLLFYPLKDEINLLPLIEDNKNFYLPRVKGDILEICPYKYGDALQCSKIKVYEPKTEPVDKNIIDIIFTPALSVDKNCYRLGYGGGFYDRLMKTSSFSKIAVIPEELVLEALPVEDYDIRCDGFVTQKKASFLRG